MPAVIMSASLAALLVTDRAPSVGLVSGLPERVKVMPCSMLALFEDSFTSNNFPCLFAELY